MTSKVASISLLLRSRYFQGTPETNPSQRHIYSTSDRWAEAKEIPTCITCDLAPQQPNYSCTFSNAIFSPKFRHFVLECQGPDIPRNYMVKRSSPIHYDVILLFDQYKELEDLMDTMSPPRIEEVLIPVPDSDRKLRAKFYYPPELRTYELIEFPLVLHV